MTNTLAQAFFLIEILILLPGNGALQPGRPHHFNKDTEFVGLKTVLYLLSPFTEDFYARIHDAFCDAWIVLAQWLLIQSSTIIQVCLHYTLLLLLCIGKAGQLYRAVSQVTKGTNFLNLFAATYM